jgi:hypothetical protein
MSDSCQRIKVHMVPGTGSFASSHPSDPNEILLRNFHAENGHVLQFKIANELAGEMQQNCPNLTLEPVDNIQVNPGWSVVQLVFEGKDWQHAFTCFKEVLKCADYAPFVDYDPFHCV